MLGLLLGAAVVLAVGVALGKWAAARRAERARPGGSLATAIRVDRFDAIDAAIAGQRCPCGGRLRVLGEGSHSEADRRFRFVHHACDDCGREGRLHFDVTAAFRGGA